MLIHLQSIKTAYRGSTGFIEAYQDIISYRPAVIAAAVARVASLVAVYAVYYRRSV